MKSKSVPVYLFGFLIAGIALFGPNSVFAENLSVEGAALDCETSIKTVNDALAEVKGVSDVTSDANLGRIVLNAANEDAAKLALEALAKSGLHGTAKYKNKSIEFPPSGATRDLKLSSFVLRNPYLGCNASVTRLQKALRDVAGVEIVEIDRVDRLVKISGKEIDVLSAVEAINKAGFHVTVQNRAGEEG